MQTVDEKLITIDFIPFLSRNKVSVSVLRTDKIHPVISGNKWFKLKYYLEDAKLQNKKRIITFGGAYSNHIVATAAACNMNGFEILMRITQIFEQPDGIVKSGFISRSSHMMKHRQTIVKVLNCRSISHKYTELQLSRK